MKTLILLRTALFFFSFLLTGQAFSEIAKVKQGKLLFQSPGHFGDSKLVETKDSLFLIANLDSHLTVVNLKALKPELLDLNIPSSWLTASAEPSGNIIIATAAFEDKRVRIYRFEPKTNALNLLSIVGDKEELKIDPALVNANGTWFLTYTSIHGEVNNSKPEGPNGHYSIKLNTSSDLSNWNLVSTIVEKEKNLEDPRLIYLTNEKALAFYFEEEDYNTGPSKLKLLFSKDGGSTWGQESIVVDDRHDNEPAGIFEVGSHLTAFFSSDKDHPGKSYEGSKAYFSTSLKGFSKWKAPFQIDFIDSILLIDAIKLGSKELVLAAVQHYGLPDSRMEVRQFERMEL